MSIEDAIATLSEKYRVTLEPLPPKLEAEKPRGDEVKCLRLKEAAKYLGISPATLYSMNTKNIIPFSKPSQRMVIYRIVDLDEYLSCNSTMSKEQIQDEARRLHDM